VIVAGLPLHTDAVPETETVGCCMTVTVIEFDSARVQFGLPPEATLTNV
jgi:hypothetical protein